MLETWVILSGALLAGGVHALLEPDHLAAIAPLAIDARRRAWVVGLRWGVGHALGIVGVGLSAYAVLDRLDLPLLRGLRWYLVGGVLLGIGAWGLMHTGRAPHAFRSRSAGAAHVHTGVAFIVGGLHGVAGSGNVLGVLPAIAQSSWRLTCTYLAGFALGTIVVTTAAAAAMGLATDGRGARAERVYRGVFLAACTLCLLLGVGLIASAALGFEPF